MQLNIKKFLSEFGLTEKEVQLYLGSLKYGPQTASTLATKTGLPRSTVNFLFTQLIQKGFASKQVEENTTYYTAIPPETLHYILEEKKATAKKLQNDFQHVLPLLKGMQNSGSPIPKVRYFQGLEGLYRTIDDCIEQDQTVLFISSHNNMHPKIRNYIESVYIKKSKTHHHKNKMILNAGKEAEEYLKKAKDVYEEIIFVDPKKNPFKLTTAIYGNKVAFISYASDDMSGIIIENHLLADHMKTIFGILEKSLKIETS